MKQDYFSDDVKNMLSLFNTYSVQYAIVGGDAVIYYGFTRLTGDTDIFYNLEVENVGKLYNALIEFWDGHVPGIDGEKDLQVPGTVVQFGVPPNRIDLMNQIEGVSFDEVWKNRLNEKIIYKGREIPVYFIGIDELIKNKKNIDRPKDNEDLKYLLHLKKI
jgi:hypothetical protein